MRTWDTVGFPCDAHPHRSVLELPQRCVRHGVADLLGLRKSADMMVALMTRVEPMEEGPLRRELESRYHPCAQPPSVAQARHSIRQLALLCHEPPPSVQSVRGCVHVGVRVDPAFVHGDDMLQLPLQVESSRMG